jgi:sortase A
MVPATSRQTVIGSALIALGLVLLAAPSVYVRITNERSAETAEALRESISAEWSEPQVEAEPDDTALLFIPKIGVWGVPIVAGVDDEALASGIGRYPNATPPGQPGNFALAGHRTANGEPFADIDELAEGDIVIVRTRSATYRYRLLDDIVVKPDKTWVIGDVTERLGLEADTSIISLVTCSPKWSTEKRWVWWGALIDDA